MANEGYPVLGSNAAVASASGVAALAKRGLLEKSRNYKFCVLAALLLLAFWSMLISSVTLRRSIGTLATGDSPDLASYEDLDILEIEEREKVVRHMWDVYTHSKTIRLPRFWQDAFRAGYESLASGAPGVRDAAVTEIAMMSLRSTVSDSFAVQDTVEVCSAFLWSYVWPVVLRGVAHNAPRASASSSSPSSSSPSSRGAMTARPRNRNCFSTTGS